jgi:hypothetical protein
MKTELVTKIEALLHTALQNYAREHGRLLIPLTVRLTEDSMPNSLKQALAPAFEAAESLLLDEGGDITYVPGVLRRWAEMVDRYIGIPHLLAFLNGADPETLFSNMNDRDRMVISALRLINDEYLCPICHQPLTPPCQCSTEAIWCKRLQIAQEAQDTNAEMFAREVLDDMARL